MNHNNYKKLLRHLFVEVLNLHGYMCQCIECIPVLGTRHCTITGVENTVLDHTTDSMCSVAPVTIQ